MDLVVDGAVVEVRVDDAQLLTEVTFPGLGIGLFALQHRRTTRRRESLTRRVVYSLTLTFVDIANSVNLCDVLCEPLRPAETRPG
jgi:hypothetical protein